MKTSLALLLLGAASLAGADEIPPPRDPLVAPPGDGRWTVEVRAGLAASPPAAEAKPVHRLAEIRCARTGPVKRETMAYADGTSEEFWYVGNLALGPAGAIDLSAVAVPSGEGPILQEPGWIGFDWLARDKYDAVVPIGKTPCYHYVRGGPDGEEAWVDARTNLPFAFRYGSLYYVYAFEAGTPGPLVLPAAAQQAYDAYRKLQDRRRQLESGN